MRLWHQDLIKQLPRQQLLGQHRECCALRGNGWKKQQSTVDYVFTYSIMRLYYYHMQVMFEMQQRGYKVEPKWQDPHYRGKAVGYDYSIDHHVPYIEHFYREHNEAYLQECLNNLAGKGVFIRLKVLARWEGPWNDAKDDAECYCGHCDYSLDDGAEEWNFCPMCGNEILYR